MTRLVTGGMIVATTVLVLLSGCERAADNRPPTTGGTTAAPAAAVPIAAGIPDHVWLATAPAGAKTVAEVKKTAAEGADVVVFGRIGGGKAPFVEGRALFMLADRSLASCVEKHGPGCTTPWDYCCEPKEQVRAGTTTIQVVGADGKPLKTGLEGVHGLKPLTEVVIAGKVATAGENVVINATGIYVKTQ
jgi:hypothetical protein